MPPVEIFKDQSITWILTVAMVIVIWYLAKFTRDFINTTVQEFRNQLADERKRSETREEKLNVQLCESIKNNARIADTLDSVCFKLDKIDKRLDEIEQKE